MKLKQFTFIILILLILFTISAVSAEEIQDNLTLSNDDADILEVSESDEILNTAETLEVQQNTINDDALQVSLNKSEEVLGFSTSKIYLWFTEEPYIELDGETDFWILNEKMQEFPVGSSIKIVAKDLKSGVTYKDSLPVESFVFERGHENVHYMVGLDTFKNIPWYIGHKYNIKVYYVSLDGKSDYLGKKTLKVKKNYNIIHQDFVTHIYSGQKISVVFYKSNGKFASGIDARLIINDKVYQTVKTNSHGVAIFDLPNKIGKFRYLGEADGFSSKYDSRLFIQHSLKFQKFAVKKSAKKLTVKVNLKKINGKFLKGANITFKFNNKVFKAKTNKYGVAKFTVKKSLLKKLKVGKKVKIKATYLKDTVTTKVKVQK